MTANEHAVTVRRVLLGVVLLAVAVGAVLWFRSRGHPDPVANQAETPARPGRQAPAPVTPDRVPAMLRDTSWSMRLRAANALRTMDALPVPRRAALLAETLDREVASPASGPPYMGSYLPLASTIRLNYLRLLEGFDAPATDAVRNAAAPSSPAGREWRTLALAATGSRESAPALRGLLSSNDPAVRMTAARYLGHLEDRDAVPALRQTLADPFTASTSGHVEPPQGGRFYPVREQAARALRLLGLKVERRGDSYTVR